LKIEAEKSSNYLRDNFSISKLLRFSKCPRMFYWIDVMKRRPPTVPEYLITGRAVHAGQEHDNLSRIEGERPPMKEVLDAAVTVYEEEGGRVVDLFRIDHDQQLSAYWKTGERDRLQPVPGTVEAPFEVKLEVKGAPSDVQAGPAVVSGFVDVLASVSGTEADQIILDYKATGRALSQSDGDDSLQLSLYMMASLTQWARFVNFISYKKQKPTAKVLPATRMSRAREEQLLEFLSETIGSIRKNLVTGDFPRCSPECWWCSPAACDFYDQCYPVKRPYLPQLVTIESISPPGTVPMPEWRKRRPAVKEEEPDQGGEDVQS